MANEYIVTEEGRRREPLNPEGQKVLEYCKEHSPVNSDDVKQFVPGISDPQGVLDSLTRAKLLRKRPEDDEESGPSMESAVFG